MLPIPQASLIHGLQILEFRLVVVDVGVNGLHQAGIGQGDKAGIRGGFRHHQIRHGARTDQVLQLGGVLLNAADDLDHFAAEELLVQLLCLAQIIMGQDGHVLLSFRQHQIRQAAGGIPAVHHLDDFLIGHASLLHRSGESQVLRKGAGEGHYHCQQQGDPLTHTAPPLVVVSSQRAR